MNTAFLNTLKRWIAEELIGVGSILTLDSTGDPLLVSRPNPDGRGEEFGYRLQLHRTNPDAPLSPFFFNLRGPDNPGKSGNLTPAIFDLSAQAMAIMFRAKGGSCTSILGVPNAGKRFARQFVNHYYPRPKLLEMKKEGDAIGGFVGPLPEDGVVLGVDDLITKAKSKLPVIERVRSHGLQMRDFVVLIDRKQGGRGELAAHGVELHSVFDVEEVLRLARDAGRVSTRSYDAAVRYLENEARAVTV